MHYDFKGKTALITGASQGMGLATAQAFADSNAAVVLADMNKELAQKEAEKLNAAGRQAIAISCDITDEAQVKAMIDTTVSTFGRLDFAFNNAGIQSPAIDIADSSSAEYDKVQNINLKGIWCCMKYELLQMRKQGNGAIVNNSSIGGLIGLPGRSIYHATKHGVLGLTKSAALDYATQGIRINAICPGTIETPMVAAMIKEESEIMKEILKMQPIGRLGKPTEIAAAVLWLCSSESSFVIGHSLVVDGGFTIQ